MPLVPAKCPECGGNINIDPEKKAAICEYCRQPFIVQEAIQNFNTTYNITNNVSNDIKAEVVNVYENKNSDFVIEAGVLKEYHGAEIVVTIPSGVVEIGRNCFSNMKHLKEVIVSEGVTIIQDCAFSFCESLKRIVLPNSISTISPSAFDGCHNVEEIIVDEQLVEKQLLYYSFPLIYSDKIKMIAEGQPISSDFVARPLSSLVTIYYSNSIKSSTLLDAIYSFASSNKNPVNVEALNKAGVKIGQEDYGVVCIYGHYVFTNDPYPGLLRVGYCDECIRSTEDLNKVIRQMEEKTREKEYKLHYARCIEEGICPRCGQNFRHFFGDKCKTVGCINYGKQYTEFE